jgi:hypothetical protein
VFRRTTRAGIVEMTVPITMDASAGVVVDVDIPVRDLTRYSLSSLQWFRAER